MKKKNSNAIKKVIKDDIEKSTNDIKKFFQREGMYRVMNSTLSMLLLGKHINFMLNVDGDSYTSKDTLVVGLSKIFHKLSYKEMFIVILALIGHEAQHVLSTDLDEYQDYIIEESNLLAQKGINLGFAREIVRSIGNIVEDGRIENILINDYPGYVSKIQFLNMHMWNEGTLDENSQDINILMSGIWSLSKTGIYPKNYDKHFRNTRVDDEINKVKPLIEKGIHAITSKECFNICREILKVITPYLLELYEEIRQEYELMDKLMEAFKDFVNDNNFNKPEKERENDKHNMSSHMTISIPSPSGDGEEAEENKNEDSSPSNQNPSDGELKESGNGSGNEGDDEAEDSSNSSNSNSSNGDDKDIDEIPEDTASKNSNSSDKENLRNDENECIDEENGGNNKDRDESIASDSDDKTDSDDDCSKNSTNKDESLESESKDDTDKSDDISRSQDIDDKEDSNQDSKDDYNKDISDTFDNNNDSTSENRELSKGADTESEEIVSNLSEDEIAEKMREISESLTSEIDETFMEADIYDKKNVTEESQSALDDKELLEFKKKYGYNFIEVPNNFELNYALPAEIKTPAKKFRKDIEKIFKNKSTLNINGQVKGVINTNDLYRVGLGDYSIFTIEGNKCNSDYVAYILQDGSGSMGGEKEINSAYALSIIEEGLRGIIPYKLTTFMASGGMIKHFTIRNWNDKGKKNYSYNFLKTRRASGGNEDGASIRVATKELLKRPERDKVLIVLSDGLPSSISDTRESIKEARANNIYVVGIMFGSDSFRKENYSTYKDMYQKNIIATSPKGIPGKLTETLKKILVR